MAYAGVSDVTNRWTRTPTDEEVTLITTRLADVERMIGRKVDIAAELEAETFTQDDLVQIEADAVLRLVRNPDGYLSETDGDYTYMLRQDLASGRLEILPDEWETLGIVQATGMCVLVPTLRIPS